MRYAQSTPHRSPRGREGNADANFPTVRTRRALKGYTRSVTLNLLGPCTLTHSLHKALAISTTPGGVSVANPAWGRRSRVLHYRILCGFEILAKLARMRRT